jgi:hypothetical protein
MILRDQTQMLQGHEINLPFGFVGSLISEIFYVTSLKPEMQQIKA